MKTYFRLLSFARPIEKFAIPYFVATIVTVVFSTLNLTLLAPLLSALFSDSNWLRAPIPKPSNWFDVMKVFNYYSRYAFIHYGGAIGVLQFVCLSIVLSVFIANTARYFAQRVMEDLRIHTLLNLRKAVFNNVMKLHLGYFNDERKGNIISKVAADVQIVQYTVTATLQVIFKEPLQLMAYVVVLFYISYKLTLFSLSVIPIAAFVIAKIVKKLKAQAIESQHAYGTLISILDEALSGIKVIKAFNATQYIIDKFCKENNRYSEIGKAMSRRQQLASPVSEFLGVAMVTCIVLYGGALIISKESELTAAEFVVYIGVFSQVMRPAKAISDAFTNIHSGIAAGERVLELIDEKPKINDSPYAVELKNFDKEIHLEGVSFSYSGAPVLKNVTIKVPKGKAIALVGPSGGGKSTLMDLILRFIEPTSGTIWVDGVDIKDIKVDSLHALIGTVNQDTILFNDTIFNNIAFGKPHSTQAQVEAAARIANAHRFIMQTEKAYQTNIGDRGAKLSGGQRQRICIARAILNNPPIMLLDEATSALDTESEKLVQEALAQLMHNRTSIVVAHRLSTIQNVDTILVVDQGEIVEEGSHLELIQKNGLYKKLIDMQAFEDGSSKLQQKPA